MPIYAMSGPYLLADNTILASVPYRTPGVFVLGQLNARGALGTVHLIGRSDTDIAAALRNHARRYQAQAFLFEAARSALQAFEMECELFHQVNKSDLPYPARSEGMGWMCPTCKLFG
jgi:hypothetical protein